MRISQITTNILVALGLLVSVSGTVPVKAQVTADQQKMNPADRQLTAKIRKSIVSDKSLSTYAHNITIVSQDGTVTLTGRVRSNDEMQAVASKAAEIAGGADKVVNQLTVQPPK